MSLEGRLAESEGKSGSEREAELEAQVAFLNSVIVDQKRKQESLIAENSILQRNKLPDLGLSYGHFPVPEA